jgi:hypothetical protein
MIAAGETVEIESMEVQHEKIDENGRISSTGLWHVPGIFQKKKQKANSD